MKIIETKGITYLEKLSEESNWYWGTDYACGDLYEAEEVFLKGNRFEPNRLIFVQYPEGNVFEPIQAKEKQYFGRPACIDGKIYILLVDFEEKMIRVLVWDIEEASIITEIPLQDVEDCYNLKLDGSPLMLTRQSHDNHFQILWPEKTDFRIGERESFYLRKENQLFFSEWYEDPEYREEVNIREYPTGQLVKKIHGAMFSASGDTIWILK